MLEITIHTYTNFACVPIRSASISLPHVRKYLVLIGCRVELRTQEGEKGLNSEEAERLVWAAQTIFATSCEPPCLSSAYTYVIVTTDFLTRFPVLKTENGLQSFCNLTASVARDEIPLARLGALDKHV